MSKIKFLNDVAEVILLMFVGTLAITLYKDESFTWFVSIFGVSALLSFIGCFFHKKTRDKAKRNKDITTCLKLAYLGNLAELIHDFGACDLFFNKQIGDCYSFISKRLVWQNQRFFVEKIGDRIFISCNCYSFKQLQQHPVSFVFNEKVYDATKNQEDKERPIIFNKIT